MVDSSTFCASTTSALHESAEKKINVHKRMLPDPPLKDATRFSVEHEGSTHDPYLCKTQTLKTVCSLS